MPDQHPDRRNTVTVVAVSADGNVAASWADIDKDEDGNIKPLAFYQPNSAKEIEVEGLLDAFWEGYRGEVNQTRHPGVN
jgi:hypothetical protein